MIGVQLWMVSGGCYSHNNMSFTFRTESDGTIRCLTPTDNPLDQAIE
jgi:hypothetical protein